MFFSRKKKSRRDSQRSQAARRVDAKRRLLVENLEDRRLLAIDLTYSGSAGAYNLMLSSDGLGTDTVALDANYDLTPGAEKILIGLDGANFQSGTADANLIYNSSADGSGTDGVAATAAKSVKVKVNAGNELAVLQFSGDAIQAHGPAAGGSINFPAPVTLDGDLILTGTYATFLYAVTGNHDITIGNGVSALFQGPVGGSGVAAIGDGIGAAITVNPDAIVDFVDTVQTRSGVDQKSGSVITFSNNIEIGFVDPDDSVASTFYGDVKVTPATTGATVA